VHDDVSLTYEFAQLSSSIRSVQIENDGALVGVQTKEEATLLCVAWRGRWERS
jgi:hypothetical protein